MCGASLVQYSVWWCRWKFESKNKYIYTTITDLASGTCRLSCLVSVELPRGALNRPTTLASDYLDCLQLEIPLTRPDPTCNSLSFGAPHNGDLAHQRNVSEETGMAFCVDCGLPETGQPCYKVESEKKLKHELIKWNLNSVFILYPWVGHQSITGPHTHPFTQSSQSTSVNQSNLIRTWADRVTNPHSLQTCSLKL